MLREMTESFAEEEVRPLAEEMDKTMVFPHHMRLHVGTHGRDGLPRNDRP